MRINGGTLVSRISAIPMVTGPGQVVLNGPAKFDTNGSNNSIDSVITGNGSLVKEGSGTLTLSALNSYTGNTIVTNGTLAISYPYLSDTNDVYLVTGGTLTLNFSGEDWINGLYWNGFALPQGIYGAGDLGGAISGTMGGRLRVVGGTPTGGFRLIVK